MIQSALHTNLSLTTPYSLCKYVAILVAHTFDSSSFSALLHILSILFLFLRHFLHHDHNILHHQCLYFYKEFLIRSSVFDFGLHKGLTSVRFIFFWYFTCFREFYVRVMKMCSKL